METPREQISKQLAVILPELKPSTINSYTSIVMSLLAYAERGALPLRVTPTSSGIETDINTLKNPTIAQEYVGEYEKKHGKPMPETTRRNIYSLLSRIFPEVGEFRVNFLDAVGEIKSKNPNVKSSREEENWMSFKEIESIYDAEWDKARPILKSEDTPSKLVLSELSNFILLAVASGVLIAPRRSTDWTEMKIRNYLPTENYYKAGKFHFNIYKTADTYGEQIVEVPRKLRDILKMYIEKNPTDYLLVNGIGGKLFESGIPPRLNKMFNGKKISTTMLRHIYLSEYHKDTPVLEDMRKTAHDMGHSITMGLEYVRRETKVSLTNPSF